MTKRERGLKQLLTSVAEHAKARLVELRKKRRYDKSRAQSAVIPETRNEEPGTKAEA